MFLPNQNKIIWCGFSVATFFMMLHLLYNLRLKKKKQRTKKTLCYVLLTSCISRHPPSRWAEGADCTERTCARKPLDALWRTCWRAWARPSLKSSAMRSWTDGMSPRSEPQTWKANLVWTWQIFWSRFSRSPGSKTWSWRRWETSAATSRERASVGPTVSTCCWLNHTQLDFSDTVN